MSNVKIWHDDIGIDEINDECYQCQVVNQEGTTVATAFGKTAEECNENSKLIAAAPDLLFALERMLEEFKVEDDDDNFLGKDNAIFEANEALHKVKFGS